MSKNADKQPHFENSRNPVEQLEKSNNMYRTLFETGRLVATQTDVNRLLTVCMDKVIEVTGAERGMIILFGSENNISYHVARNLQKQDVDNPEFQVSHSIIERVKQTRESFCSMNAIDDPEVGTRQSVSDLKILSVVCVPIIHNSVVNGVIYADNRKFTSAFNQDTCNFLTCFSEQIAHAVRHAFTVRAMKERVGQLEDQLRTRFKFETIVGQSPEMIQIMELVTRVADTDAPVMIEGETGTGKELFAKALHYNSSRQDRPFISINCGALPEQLLESELFGYERGAFTGAVAYKMGKFEAASKGTIFLDEISEMDSSLQVKLLRVLQSGEYSPLGCAANKQCDVRIVAATNQNLNALLEKGSFRQDLYYRLNVVCLEIPPLRERRNDIPLFIEHFLAQYAKDLDKEKPTISEAALHVLTLYDFPGNVRELQNIVRRATILNRTGYLEVSDLPTEVTKGKTDKKVQGLDFHEARDRVVENFERQYLTSLLKQNHGVIRESARKANLNVKNFRLKLKKYGIDAKRL